MIFDHTPIRTCRKLYKVIYQRHIFFIGENQFPGSYLRISFSGAISFYLGIEWSWKLKIKLWDLVGKSTSVACKNWYYQTIKCPQTRPSDCRLPEIFLTIEFWSFEPSFAIINPVKPGVGFVNNIYSYRATFAEAPQHVYLAWTV